MKIVLWLRCKWKENVRVCSNSHVNEERTLRLLEQHRCILYCTKCEIRGRWDLKRKVNGWIKNKNQTIHFPSWDQEEQTKAWALLTQGAVIALVGSGRRHAGISARRAHREGLPEGDGENRTADPPVGWLICRLPCPYSRLFWPYSEFGGGFLQNIWRDSPSQWDVA